MQILKCFKLVRLSVNARTQRGYLQIVYVTCGTIYIYIIYVKDGSGAERVPKTGYSPPENERHTDSAIYIYTHSYSRVYPVVGGSDNFKCQLYRGLVI